MWFYDSKNVLEEKVNFFFNVFWMEPDSESHRVPGCEFGEPEDSRLG